MNYKELLAEASSQTKEIKKLEKWSRILLSVSSIFLVIAYWGLQREKLYFIFGILGVVLTILCFFLASIINLGVKRAKKNVEVILKLIENKNI